MSPGLIQARGGAAGGCISAVTLCPSAPYPACVTCRAKSTHLRVPQGPPHTCTSSSRPPAPRGLQSAEPRGHLRQQRDQPARRRGLRLRLRLHAGPVLGHTAPGDLQRRPRPPGRVLQGEAGPPWGWRNGARGGCPVGRDVSAAGSGLASFPPTVPRGHSEV